MDKYIKELLLLHSKIILPQFGAIVVENEETGELMFNEYLSYDDGKLADLIQSESNIDTQEAQNVVAKFVRELQGQLDKGESYSIFQLGEFNKNEDGEITFVGNIKAGTSSQPKTKSEKPAASTTVPPTQEKDKVEPAKTKEKSESKKEETKKKNTYLEKEKSPATADDSAKKEEVKEVKKKKNIKAKKEATKKEKKPKEPGKKKKIKPIVWILLFAVLLLGAGAIYIALNYEKVETYMGWNKFENIEHKNDNTTTEEENVSLPEHELTEEDNSSQPEEEIIAEEIEELPVIEENEIVPQAPIAPVSSGRFHIMVGSFSEINNANNLVEKLRREGFDARIVGESGGLHHVSAQRYSTRSEAAASLSKVQQIESSAYILNTK